MENYLSQYQDYLLKEKKFSLHTVNAYIKDVQDFLVFIENDVVSVHEIVYLHIRQWLVHLSSQGLGNNSINRKVASLKSYFRFLFITKTIAVYPLEGHKSLRTEKVLQVPFSEQEMQKIDRSHFKNDFFGLQEFVIISLFYSLGIRKSELIDLKVSDVDLKRRELKVLGKRSKERIVPLISETADVLSLYLAERNERMGTDLCPNLFVLKNNKKLNQTFVYRLINNYFRRVTSKGKKSPHMLRHTFATHMLNAGADLNTIKEVLGHASLSSTQIYTHTSLAALKKTYAQAHPRFLDDEDLL